MWTNIDIELKNILPLRVLQQCVDGLLVARTQTEAELDASLMRADWKFPKSIPTLNFFIPMVLPLTECPLYVCLWGPLSCEFGPEANNISGRKGPRNEEGILEQQVF